MANEIKTPIRLEVAKAKRDADALEKQVKKVGVSGAAAGKKTGQELTAAGRAAQNFTRQLVGIGTGLASLEAVRRVVTSIIEAYNKAIQVRDQFVQRGVGAMGGLAPLAAQFGLPEAQAARFAAGVAGQAGMGPGQWPDIGGIFIAMRSAGMIGPGAITPGAGKMPQVQPGVAGIGATLGQFAGMTGMAGGQADQLVKLVARGLGGQKPTPESVNRILAQVQAAFVEAEATDWGDFIAGAMAPMAQLQPVGIGFEKVLAQYSALVKTRHRPMGAGETLSQLGRELFTAADPKLVRWFGRERYWQMRKEDPTALYSEITSRLLEPEGEEAARLYKQVGLGGVTITQLQSLRGVSPVEEVARGRIAAAEPGAMATALAEWRAGPRPIYGAAETAAEMRGMAMTPAAAMAAGARAIGKVERERLRGAEPLRQRVREAVSFEWTEINDAFRRWLRQEYRTMYGQEMPAYVPDTTGEELRFGIAVPGAGPVGRLTLPQLLEREPRLAPIFDQLRGGGTTINNTTNIGVNYGRTPADTAHAGPGAVAEETGK